MKSRSEATFPSLEIQGHPRSTDKEYYSIRVHQNVLSLQCILEACDLAERRFFGLFSGGHKKHK